MTYRSSLFYEHFIFIKGWLSPGRPFPHSAELEVIFLKRVPLLEQTEQELTSHIKSFWKRPGIGSGVDIIQMQMHFISGLPWMPNFGAKGELKPLIICSFLPINRMPTTELIFFFQTNVIGKLQKTL